MAEPQTVEDIRKMDVLVHSYWFGDIDPPKLNERIRKLYAYLTKRMRSLSPMDIMVLAATAASVATVVREMVLAAKIASQRGPFHIGS